VIVTQPVNPEPGFSSQSAVPVAVSNPPIVTQAVNAEPGFTTQILPTTTAPATPATPVATADPKAGLQGPTLDGAPISSAGTPVVAAATVVEPVSAAPAVQTAPTPAFDLASIVNAIEIPESEQKPSAAAAKAAAEAASKTAKVDPKTAAKGKAEAANPARFWVQIATGDVNALGYDYRKWSKKSADLFKGQNGWTSAWGKTSRLLVGPFGDQKAAKKWEGDFKKAGGNGFMWKSENGVAVTALKSK
jgi:hypothetical protein